MNRLVTEQRLGYWIFCLVYLSALDVTQLKDTAPVEAQCVSLIPPQERLCCWVYKINYAGTVNGYNAVVDRVNNNIRFTFNRAKLVC